MCLTSISLRSHFDVTSISIRLRFDRTSISLSFHCGFLRFHWSLLPLHLDAFIFHSGLAWSSLQIHVDSTQSSLRELLGIRWISQLSRFDFGFTSLSLRFPLKSGSPSLRVHFELASMTL